MIVYLGVLVGLVTVEVGMHLSGMSLTLLHMLVTLFFLLGCFIQSYCNLLCHIWVVAQEGQLFSFYKVNGKRIALGERGLKRVEGGETVVCI